MTQFVRATRGKRVRRLGTPALALAALALTAQAAFAIGGQAKPEIRVEAERSPQGARLTFKGKGWAPGSRVKITATRAPGATGAQDFGMFTADDKGAFQERKTAPCSTNNVDDATEQVTFTAADSASGAKVTTRVQGGAWQCQ